MRLKFLVDEDFVNYKKPSMFLGFPNCSLKCDKLNGCSICQNSSLINAPNIEIRMFEVVDRYLNNRITKAIVCGGLEPFDSWTELKYLVESIRMWTNDDIVIYTVYEEDEIKNEIQFLSDFKNIYVKFGRFIMNDEKRFDEVLGVELASSNQYAKKISQV